MGTIRKRNGKYQAQVRREGVKPVSKTFLTKKDAEVWVRGIEARIDAGEVNLTMPESSHSGQTGLQNTWGVKYGPANTARPKTLCSC